ncbi:MAG: helix-turn-helix domain-containing protein [Burkholderiaceae bacterium]
MAAVVQASGAITIADVVREAGVSKRSFYEHFESKEACFLALYAAASASALRTLRESLDPAQPWEHQIERGLRAYFEHLAAGPGLLRALFVDIHFLGDAGARARREVMQSLADYMLDTVNGKTAAEQPLRLSPVRAMAAVGAVNELVLLAIESNQVGQLAELTQDSSDLVRLMAQMPLAACD